MRLAVFAKTATYLMRAALGWLVLMVCLLWLGGTELVLQQAARQAEKMSAGQLVLKGVHGSLYGPLRIESLGFHTRTSRIEATEVTLDWSPLALLGGEVRVNRLALRELAVTGVDSDNSPMQLPMSLHLPVRLSAPAIDLDRLVIKGTTLNQRLTDIHFSLNSAEGGYRLHLNSIRFAGAAGQAEIVLGDSKPYRVVAHAGLNKTAEGAYQAEADATGDLLALMVQGKVTTSGGKAEIQAKLVPFESFPIAEATIKASGIDPALFGNDFPVANLSADIFMARHKADTLEGRILLRNTIPGPWDRARLPLSELNTRFSGDLSRFDLHGFHLDLAAAGHLEGKGQIRGKRLQLELVTSGLDPRGLYSPMRSMRLAGNLVLDADQDGQRVAADLNYQRFRLHLDAQQKNSLLELREATIRSGMSKLSLQGTLALREHRQFEVKGSMAGFNPADFGAYPQADLNISLAGAGQLETEPQALLEFVISSSHFRHSPLSGQGKLHLSASRFWDGELALQLANNRLKAAGALGRPTDKLGFELEAANLALLAPQISGKLLARGVLEGNVFAPSGNISMQLDGLSWGEKQQHLDSLQAEGRLEQGDFGQLTLNATLRGLHTPKLNLDQARLSAQGTRSAHTLQLQAKGGEIDAEGRLEGGWKSGDGWSGQLLSLVNRGRTQLSLDSPTRLEMAPGHLLLSDAHLELAGGNFIVHEAAYHAGQIDSRGEFTGLPAAYLLARLGALSGASSDLVLGGGWQLSVGDQINGHAAIWRERGDIPLEDDPQTMLGLARMALDLDIVNNQLQGRLEARGTHLGTIRADVKSTLSERNGVWGIAGDAPVQASADVAVDNLAWLRPLLDQTGATSFDGAVRANVQVSGTVAQPKLSGSLSGERMRVTVPSQGLSLGDGRIRAELMGNELHLHEVMLRGGQGKLIGQGRMTLGSGALAMKLSLVATGLEVSSRPDRHLVLSGNGEVSLRDSELKLSAKLRADRGLIELSTEDAPVISEDVELVGQPKVASRKESSYGVKANLELDLGTDFKVSGMGLDAQLGGALVLASMDDGRLSARGNIQVVKGTYKAYGKRLEIERGVLTFQGPIANPGLNIVALRKNQQVEAGVAVTGTVESPRVKLISNPVVSDSQKLSWLVLGHELDAASNTELSTLQAAAGALLTSGDSSSLQQKIAHAAGLEEISLRNEGELKSTVLTLGKQLSSRAYISYERGLTSLADLVKINYSLSQRLSVRVQAGKLSAVDLFYTFSFK